jgi:hypothetical protein
MGNPFGLALAGGTRFLCIVLFVAGALPESASAQRSNLERLQLCARQLADSLLVPFHGGDSVAVATVEHPAGWLVDGQFLQAAESQGITVLGGDRVPSVRIAVLDIGVEYRQTDESDRLQRTAALGLNSVVSLPLAGSSESARTVRDLRTTLVDTIDASQALGLESPGYPFSKGIVTATGSPGFWEKIVEPVVVLGASVVMVILLFTVRSQ